MILGLLGYYLFIGFCIGAREAIDSWPRWKTTTPKSAVFGYPFFIMFLWLPMLILVLGFLAYEVVADKTWRKKAERSL